MTIVALVLSPIFPAAAEPEPGAPKTGAERPDRRRHAREDFAWPHAEGPHYGKVAEPLRRAPGTLHTEVGSFRLGTEGALDIPAALKATNKLDRLAAQYFVVQFDPRQLDRASVRRIVDSIERAGGAIVRRVPVGAVIARLTPEAWAALQRQPGLIAVEPWHPAFKIAPYIGQLPLADADRARSESYDLDVQLFPGERPEAVAAILSALGGSVTAILGDTVHVQIHRSKLAEVAAIEGVAMIHEKLPMYTFGEETTATVQTGALNGGPGTAAVPYHAAGVTGNGGSPADPQVLMIIDDGIEIDAADLSDSHLSAGVAGTGHRKVRRFIATNPWGGLGNSLGCYPLPTHGHQVAATALGNATTIVLTGAGGPHAGGFTHLVGPDLWHIDGVAPGAVLAMYDAGRTSDCFFGWINPGDLYTPEDPLAPSPPDGSIYDAYSGHGAQTINLSWGSSGNFYDLNASDIDLFLADHPDAMVFAASGQDGFDVSGVPVEGTLGTGPANSKNAIVLGASAHTNPPADTGPASRLVFSAMGPTRSDRVSPLLTAPGGELGGTGIASEYACWTNDDNQIDPVQCLNTFGGQSGTSFSSAAAAGAGMLVRDWFVQGFYPDGTGTFSGVPNPSGALVKAVLVASAEFMTGANLARGYRFSNEQGYGRLQLDNALPLSTWGPAPALMLAVDGVVAGNPIDLPGLDGYIETIEQSSQQASFEVCDDTEELRIALAWIDDAGSTLVQDLDLTVVSPTGDRQATYFGNLFTDDFDRDGVVDPDDEDCGGPGEPWANGALDASAWSLPADTCKGAVVHDSVNPTEAVFLSPDPDGDPGTDDAQVRIGTWTVEVSSRPLGLGGVEALGYALVVVGGLCPLGDFDGDGSDDVVDNCPEVSNAGQSDGDGDGLGDDCDLCPADATVERSDLDGDGEGDLCDLDDDDDGILDDGDGSGYPDDAHCTGGATAGCDDNCRTEPNSGQEDADADGTGDVCDEACSGAGGDADGDLVCDASDNCAGTPNPLQTDTDADTVGDACDGDSDNDGIDDDGDGSGLTGDAPCTGGATAGCDDNCPAVANSGQADGDSDGIGDDCDPCPSQADTQQRRVRLSADLVPGGNVVAYVIAGGGTHVVYAADQEINDVFEIYSVPMEGGTPTKLNDTLVAGESVWAFDVTPDGQNVVYRAYDNGAVELWSVPLTGGTPTKLNGTLTPGGGVASWFISPDSSFVAYLADQATPGVFELWHVPIGGGAVTQLNDTLVAGGNVVDYRVSANNVHVVYVADRTVDEQFELYSADVTIGSSSVIPQSGGMVTDGDVVQFELTPAGTVVIFRADAVSDEDYELFSSVIGLTLRAQLSGTLPTGGDVLGFSIADDSTAIYLADQTTDGTPELFGVPPWIGSWYAISDPLVTFGEVTGWVTSPDGANVAYVGQGVAYNQDDLFTSPASGGGATLVSPPYSGAGSDVVAMLYTPDSSRLVSLADRGSASLEYFGVPSTGGTTIRINDDLPEGAAGVVAANLGEQETAYLADQTTVGKFELWGRAYLGGTVTRLTPDLPDFCDFWAFEAPTREAAGADGACTTADDWSYLFGRDGTCGGGDDHRAMGPVVYLADVRADGVFELWATPYVTDSDDDGLDSNCDPCTDLDGDGLGDPAMPGTGDVSCPEDACPLDPDNDSDSDGVCVPDDNCPVDWNDQTDTDGDGAGDTCDCAPSDPSSFALVPEIVSLHVESDRTTIAWTAGPCVYYDVVRGKIAEFPVGTGASETCVEPGTVVTHAADASMPAVGEGYYYLVRGSNACGPGTWGFDSALVERTTTICP